MICASYTRSNIKHGMAIPISEQNEKIAAFLKGRRLTVDQKYSDRKEEISANEGFEEMKAAGIQRKFDCIVFWSLMYFGDDALVGYNLLLHTFIPAGIDFAVVSDNFISIGHSTDEIQEYLASKYRERRNEHMKYFNSLSSGSRMNTLYGYEKHGEEFIIDEVVEPIVKRIFAMRLDGKGYSEIREILNKENVESAHHYLKRVAGRSLENVSFNWDTLSIKKILTDKRYMGVRTVTCKGKTAERAIAAYISKDEYEKMQSLISHYETRQKSVNLFSKKIYDKESHIRLYMGDYIGEGNQDYHISKIFPGYEQYKKKVILVSEVEKAVWEQLKSEIDLSRHILCCIKSSSGQAEIAQRKDSMREQYVAKINELLEVIEREPCLSEVTVGSEQAQAISGEVADLFKKMETIDLALSENNPWLQLYSSVEVPNFPTADFYKEMIREVLVERFEKVVMIPQHNEWKQLLPEYWMEK